MLRSIALLATFAACATANAATLSMSIANVDLPNLTAEIGVHLDLVSGDTLAGVFFALEDNPDVIHVSTSTPIPNWGAEQSSTNLPLGLSQFNVFAHNPLADSLTGPGAITVGSFDLTLPSDMSLYPIEVAFGTGWPFQLVQEDGQFYIYDPQYASYPGYFELGAGDPSIPHMMDRSERNALLIMPEPASLGYLAMAVFALIARRRAA